MPDGWNWVRWIIVAGNYKYKNMKKSTLRFIFTVILIGTSITSYSQYRYSGISDIEKHGDWYRVYSETGKEIKSMYAPSVGELVGSASNFFIMRRGDWYDLYNARNTRRSMHPLSEPLYPSTTTGSWWSMTIGSTRMTGLVRNWTVDIHDKSLWFKIMNISI